jgi:hypothetical protein
LRERFPAARARVRSRVPICAGHSAAGAYCGPLHGNHYLADHSVGAPLRRVHSVAATRWQTTPPVGRPLSGDHSTPSRPVHGGPLPSGPLSGITRLHRGHPVADHSTRGETTFWGSLHSIAASSWRTTSSEITRLSAEHTLGHHSTPWRPLPGGRPPPFERCQSPRETWITAG